MHTGSVNKFGKRNSMKFFYTICLLVFTCTAFAQLTKGTRTLSTGINTLGNLNFTYNGPSFRSYNFSINPNFGYFIKDRLEIGGGPIIGFSGERISDGVANQLRLKNNLAQAGLNAYTRFYFKNEGNIVPYGVVNARYFYTWGTLNDAVNNLTEKSSDHTFQWGGGIGAAWFVVPRAALFGEFTANGTLEGLSGLTIITNLNLGFTILLGSK